MGGSSLHWGSHRKDEAGQGHSRGPACSMVQWAWRTQAYLALGGSGLGTERRLLGTAGERKTTGRSFGPAVIERTPTDKH